MGWLGEEILDYIFDEARGSIEIAGITMYLPKYSQNYYFISEDLTDYLGTEDNYQAEKKIKKRIKQSDKKLKVKFESEYGSVVITSRNGKDLLEVMKFIVQGFEEEAFLKAEQVISNWKRPKPQKWSIGDVFAIPLRNGSFAYGQIIGDDKDKGEYADVGEYAALFQHRSETVLESLPPFTQEFLQSIRRVSLQGVESYKFKILENVEIAVTMPADRRYFRYSTADFELQRLAEAIDGLRPWLVDDWTKEVEWVLYPKKEVPPKMRIVYQDEEIENENILIYESKNRDYIFRYFPLEQLSQIESWMNSLENYQLNTIYFENNGVNVEMKRVDVLEHKYNVHVTNKNVTLFSGEKHLITVLLYDDRYR